MPTDSRKFTTIMLAVETAKSLKEIQNLFKKVEKKRVGATEVIDKLILVFKNTSEYKKLNL